MKFNLYSDLHIEFSRLDLVPSGDVLLLSGDICIASVFKPDRTDREALKGRPVFLEWFEKQSANFNKVFYIGGNHEHYHGVIDKSAEWLRDGLKHTKVQFLENESVDLGNDVVLYGTTLWTDFRKHDPMVMQYAQFNMNDYRLIDFDKKGRFTPEAAYEIHVNSLQKLSDFLDANKDKKVVVMTHHAPSFKSKHPRYSEHDVLNYAYYSDLDQFILDHPQIKVWTHGHTHESHDYMIGDTRVICNPRGYSYRGNEDQENKKFDINKEFEVI